MSRREVDERTDLTDDDFMTAVAAGLALMGRQMIWLDHDAAFDKAMEAAYRWLVAERPDLDMRFLIILHPGYGDSQDVRTMVARAHQRGIFSLDTDGVYRIQFGACSAPAYLRTIPIDEDEARALARFVIDGLCM